jgi:dipeptidase D
MSILKSLQPADVWSHFAALCDIPRPSGHEQRAAEYVRAVASQCGLHGRLDATGNVLVHKPATPGLERTDRVMLQCHLDMVPQAHGQLQHDFLHDPIQPVVEGEWVHAEGTTLGADNGMGVAIALAVLGDTALVHGPLSALFTVEEETGLFGAARLQADMLDSDVLINLDGENEQELLVGCAGGTDICAELPGEWVAAPKQTAGFRLAISGLRGGHSGADIHLGRGNGIKLAARFLSQAIERHQVQVCTLEGGSARNAIPREAGATGVVPSSHSAALRCFAAEYEREMRQQLGPADPDFVCRVSTTASPEQALTPECLRRVLRALITCPNGVLDISESYHGVTESSNNVARVSCRPEDEPIAVECLLRSFAERRMEHYTHAIRATFDQAGGVSRVEGCYPGWEPDPDSRLVHLMSEVYRRRFGHDADVKVIHAGLECGIIRAKKNTLDCISCGPTIQFPHSPDERVRIDSVARFYCLLTETLHALASP